MESVSSYRSTPVLSNRHIEHDSLLKQVVSHLFIVDRQRRNPIHSFLYKNDSKMVIGFRLAIFT